MNDFFGRVAARVLGVTPRVTPRLASRYEPHRPAADLDSSGYPDDRRTPDAEPRPIHATTTAPHAVRSPRPSDARQPTESIEHDSDDAVPRPPPAAASLRSDVTLASDRAPSQRRADAGSGSGPTEGDGRSAEPSEPSWRAAPPDDGPSPGSVSAIDRAFSTTEDGSPLETYARVVTPNFVPSTPPLETVRQARSSTPGDSSAVVIEPALGRPPAGEDPGAQHLAREPEPDEAAPRRPTTESREAPPAEAGQAAIEHAGHSVVEDDGPLIDQAPTFPEPELAVHRPRLVTDRQRPDLGSHDGPSRSVAAPGPDVDRGPVVRVTIGRVEVRAVQPAVNAQEAQGPSSAWSPGVLSLDDYLEQRKGLWR